jgi:hypothetical protein
MKDDDVVVPGSHQDLIIDGLRLEIYSRVLTCFRRIAHSRGGLTSHRTRRHNAAPSSGPLGKDPYKETSDVCSL